MQGSGFVWDTLGHVVTNWHVVARAERQVQVTLASGAKHLATLRGAEPDKDLAGRFLGFTGFLGFLGLSFFLGYLSPQTPSP